MVIVLMGVSGSGKTTVGKVLAGQLGWTFHDADDFHPEANIEKMSEGTPLTDDDRLPWLRDLARAIGEATDRGRDLVLACSALKRSYRDHLVGGKGSVRFVLLEGSPELIQRRIAARRGHFMDPDLLASQFEAMEESVRAIAVDITPPPGEIAEEIRVKLGIA